MANKKINKFANVSAEVKEAPAAEIKTEEAAAPEVKTEIKPEKVKTEIQPEKAKTEIKPEKAKTEKAPKAAKAPKTEKPKADEAEKPAAKKAADKTPKVVVQFSGKEYDTAEIVEKCKAAYKADNSRKQVRSIEVYIKPEDGKAYYVVNGKGDGLSIDL